MTADLACETEIYNEIEHLHFTVFGLLILLNIYLPPSRVTLDHST